MLNKIFSIKYDENDCRTVITILGIKIKIAGKELKDNKFQHFKDAGGKITDAPKADGIARITQLANLQLLKEVDEYCRRHDLKLWLTFGTLLGAVRHGGYIPWDDDIDVEMLREDYEKLTELLKSEKDIDFYPEFIHSKKDCNIFLKIRHKKISGIFIDIFPLDELGDILTNDQRRILSIKMKIYRHSLNNKISKYIKNGNEAELLKFIDEKRKTFLKPHIENSDYVWGLDFEHKRHKYLIFPHSTYFPLKKIAFENTEFYCPNKTKEFLSEVFGDYMAWPTKLYTHHLRFPKNKTLKGYYGEETFIELEKYLQTNLEELTK